MPTRAELIVWRPGNLTRAAMKTAFCLLLCLGFDIRGNPSGGSSAHAADTLLLRNLGRWAIGPLSNCRVPRYAYDLSLDKKKQSTIVWRSGLGEIDTEAIVEDGETESQTVTLSSIHLSDRGNAPGTKWTYSSLGRSGIQVAKNGRNVYSLSKCP